MPYLIDTDWVIDHLAGEPEAMKLLAKLTQQGMAISMITYMEAFQGTEREPNPQAAQTKLDTFLEVAPILPFSLAVARRCARLRETLKRQGRYQKTPNPRILAPVAGSTNRTPSPPITSG